MYKTYDKWPELARGAYNSEIDQVEFNESNNILFAGMDGSGTISDAFFSIYQKLIFM